MTLLTPEIVLLYTLLAKADLGDLEAVDLTMRTILVPRARALARIDPPKEKPVK